MNIYLPIAELSVNALLLLGIGGALGLLSGIFGVGGGFLMTPLLMLFGIPPAVAVATGSNQIVASSFSGALSHWRRGTLDVKMGLVLLAGGLVGSFIGVRVFAIVRELGQTELVVSLLYVVFLGIVGVLMLVESINTIRRSKSRRRRQKGGQHNFLHGLPFKMRFRASNLYISAIPPVLVGGLVGILAALMGVGGGFIMVPAMIYLLGMATTVVVGTSLFQIMFVTGFTTLAHAITNQTVDAILALLLILGGVVGTQVGVLLAPLLRPEQLRIMLALLVVAICLALGWQLVSEPAELYTIASETG